MISPLPHNLEFGGGQGVQPIVSLWIIDDLVDEGGGGEVVQLIFKL